MTLSLSTARRLGATFGLVLAAATAQAQSLATLEACVARYGGAEQTAEACSMELFDACLDTRPGQTTLDRSDCMQQGHAIWDAYLNKLWAPMKARAQADGTWGSLLASQRQWIAYRDAECERVYNEYSGGSMRLIATPACQRDLTAQKTMQFYRALMR